MTPTSPPRVNHPPRWTDRVTAPAASVPATGAASLPLPRLPPAARFMLLSGRDAPRTGPGTAKRHDEN